MPPIGRQTKKQARNYNAISKECEIELLEMIKNLTNIQVLQDFSLHTF